MDNRKVSIIGLGLIGGSIAKALHERLGLTDITAVDPDMAAVSKAVDDGTILRGFTEINDYVYDSDIIFICTPVKQAVEYVKLISGKVRPGCIVTDVGSTKSEIIECINNIPCPPCFIGGHPMTGSEKNGYSASAAHIFENAYYILSPSKSTTDSAMEYIQEVVRAIGAIPIVLEFKEHDRVTGGISHVPHVIAAALVNLVKKMDSADGKMQMLAAGGFKDITRIASSSPGMWENITLSNKQQISKILDSYIDMLEGFKEHLDLSDSKDVYDFFHSAKIFRDSFPVGKVGLISPMHEIIVDVVDKPGIIGEIATILGNKGINIKNINVSNSREFEQGCLKITLPDHRSVDEAFDLLTAEGYKVYKTS